MTAEPVFSQSDLYAIAHALADGLTGAEIGPLLPVANMRDLSPSMTKWKRLYNAFVARQNDAKNRRAILQFIRESMNPRRYLNSPDHFENVRANLNRALAFSGLAVNASGVIEAVDPTQTIAEANRRADELRVDLTRRGVHADVLSFCRAELVTNNYFHAVLESTKSIAEKLRSKTGLTEDGADLVDRALCGEAPYLAINAFKTKSQRSEQSGFANLIKGTFGMFRNPTAHEARILWDMKKEDAEDLLSLASLIHRRLDGATVLLNN